MNSRFFLGAVAVMCFSLGIATGRITSASSRATASKPVLRATVPGRSSVNSTEEKKNALAEPVVAKTTADGYRARLRALAELNQLVGNKFAVPLVTFDRLNEDFIRVYGLTPAEVTEINAALQAAKQRVAQIAAAQAVIEPKGSGQFTITIRPFPDEGGQIYNGLLDSIHRVLGDERFASWRTSSNDMDSMSFGTFGLLQATIEVRPIVDDRGKPTAMSSSSFRPETGVQESRSEINPAFFPTQYPELYSRMVAAGLWPNGNGP